MDLLKEDKFYCLDRAYRLDGVVKLEVVAGVDDVVETHVGRIEAIYHTNNEGNVRICLKCEDGGIVRTFVNAETEVSGERSVLCTPMGDGFLHRLTVVAG